VEDRGTNMKNMRGPDRSLAGSAAGSPRLRVAALASYPVEGASTRFRIQQFLHVLAEHDVDVTLLPFLSSRTFQYLYHRRRWLRNSLALLLGLLRRIMQLRLLWSADTVFVQREAMLFGPPVVEWFVTRIAHRPMVLDLDDPTYITQVSPVYGRFAAALKWPGKTDWLIDHAALVICGNDRIADYVRGRGARATVIQTIADTAVFTPRAGSTPRDVPVIGWVGSHSTYPYFEAIIPILEDLATEYHFRVRIVGSGREAIGIRGVEVDTLPWDLQRELFDFQTLDIGVYPLPHDVWAEGKSGLKAIEYLAVGVPYVASSSLQAGIGEPGKTHLVAETAEEWRHGLAQLLGDAGLRAAMGKAGRAYAVENYSMDDFGNRIAVFLRQAQAARQPLEQGEKRAVDLR
jgi:glycosyltransferase involved in cell wall biosynthesis